MKFDFMSGTRDLEKHLKKKTYNHVFCGPLLASVLKSNKTAFLLLKSNKTACLLFFPCLFLGDFLRL